MSRWTIIPLSLLVWLALAVPQAWAALETPVIAESLSSAGVGAGNPIVDAAGRPVIGANGRPVLVNSVATDAATLAPSSIAGMLKLSLTDLFSYATRLGISMPMAMSGTMTTVRRSDGGVEHVFVFTTSDGSQVLMLADTTGANTYGIRIAKVDPSGRGSILTAHGLNGNFTNPPWYLSARAKADYWIRTDIAQLWDAAPVPSARIARLPSEDHGAKVAVFGGDYFTGNQKPFANAGRLRAKLGADRVSTTRMGIRR